MIQPHLHGTEPPSAWVQRWSHLVKPGGRVLDVACGSGRHVRWFAEHQHHVTAVDVSAEALSAIHVAPADCEKIVADLENGPWPLPNRQFDAVVVTNYLWRALLPQLITSLRPGGVLIYETFAQGNETVGKPSRPDFLLRTGELLSAFSTLRVVAFEDGFEPESGTTTPVRGARFVQRIVAAHPLPGSEPVRYTLPPL